MLHARNFNQQWPHNPANPGGAWDYHETIIAEADPRPIRVWMAVGDADLLNPNIMRDGMHDRVWPIIGWPPC